MSRISREGVAVAGGFAVTATSISYSIHGLTPTFVVSALNGVVVASLPGWVLTVGILGMGDSAQGVGLVLSTVTVLVLYAALAGAGLWLRERLRNTMVSIVIPVVGVWAVEILLAGDPTVAVYSSFGGGAVIALSHLAGVSRATEYLPERIKSPARRRLLASVGVAATTSLWGVTTGQKRVVEGELSEVNADAATEATETVEAVRSQSLAVDGLEPLVSESFFRVDISAVDPVVDRDQYSLTVTDERDGSTKTYSYDDLVAQRTETVTQTLRCVGEGRNGTKTDTAVWTAVPMTEVLDFDAYDGACCVVLRAADGYYQEFPLDALETATLAYGMNGELLPRAHGHPVRALVPGHWGEINVKWLTEIEIRDETVTGYWEKRGWHGTGPVNTVAKLHVVNHHDDGTIEVAGHAYAGTRGVSAVEVSTDGGETWETAETSERVPGADVWRQWVYRYEKATAHDVVVRAVEDDGTVQPDTETGPYPNGASGYVSARIRP